jgi:hypothetical protein
MKVQGFSLAVNTTRLVAVATTININLTNKRAMDLNKLDLETLKHIKFTFDLYSDMSSKTLGYQNLCRLIFEREQAKTQQPAEQLQQTDVIKSVCPICKGTNSTPCTMFKDSNKCSDCGCSWGN